MKKTNLLLIDCQVDFCDPKGALFVPGADKDMERLAAFINLNQNRISEIYSTLDSHQSFHISHPIFWVNSMGEHPIPFTIITDSDVKDGKWKAFHPNFQQSAQNYVDKLKETCRYELCIWPPHCIIGSLGHSLYPEISDALIAWETNTINLVNYVTKGSNFLTEQHSAIMAAVPDDLDPSTKLNNSLIGDLFDADEVLVSGEALSHCVANTIMDIIDNIDKENIKKITLIEDTTSNIPNFEKFSEDFIKNIKMMGVKIVKTSDW